MRKKKLSTDLYTLARKVRDFEVLFNPKSFVSRQINKFFQKNFLRHFLSK